MFKRMFALLFVLIFTFVFAVSAQDDMSEDPLVRLSHFGMDAPSLNVYINGEVFGVDGEANIYDPGFVYDYLSFPVGTYNVAFVPDGADMDEALIGPVDLTVQEGHRYNAIIYGQMADESLAFVLLDETVGMQEDGVEDAVAPVILFQGISEIPAVDIYAGDALFLENIPFGEVRIIDFPLSVVPITITVHDDPDTIVLQEDFFGVPNTLAIAALVGSFPDAYTRIIMNTTDLSALEFFIGAADSPVMSFDTLVASIDVLLEAGFNLSPDPNSTFFAPTDAAFADLPEGALDELMADPELLAAVLLYHGAEGRFYLSDILDEIMASGSASIETALGEDIFITATEDGLFVNDTAQIIYADIQVSDGIIHVINGVLIPPEE